MLNVVIFSKDRGCQLELLLRSAARYLAGWHELPVAVLYTYSTVEFAAGYDRTRRLHSGPRYVCERVDERPFRDLVLSLVDPANELTVFFVDDDVFRAPFSLGSRELDLIRNDPEIACVSLRLCPRLIYTYTLDLLTPPPPIEDGVFRWVDGEGGWGYPMSLDGHVFRTAEIRPLLEVLDYSNPNSLEHALAAHPLTAEKGVCVADAAIVNIPANRVQDTFPNRHGDVPAEVLNERFLAGERLRLEPIAAVQNLAVHQEIGLEWEPIAWNRPRERAQEVPREVDYRAVSSSVAERYFIKEGYRENGRPEYWDDDVDLGGKTWQPDVYRDAVTIAERLGLKRVVDVGCGNARKLARLHPRFEIVGVDFGSNLDVCRTRYPFGVWLEHDLETDEPLPVSADLLDGAVVVCADVVEHLVRPELLLQKLRWALDHSGAVLVSTPERNLARGIEHMGPPPRPHHVREWAIDEFAAFLENEGFEHGNVTLTRSNDIDEDHNTILGTLFRNQELARIGLGKTAAAAA